MAEPVDEGDRDSALSDAVAAALGVDLPAACAPGVAANARLLASHWQLLQAALGTEPDA